MVVGHSLTSMMHNLYVKICIFIHCFNITDDHAHYFTFYLPVHWIEGWRLDYFLVSESIAEKVHDSYILPDISASDHSPLGLVLKLYAASLAMPNTQFEAGALSFGSNAYSSGF